MTAAEALFPTMEQGIAMLIERHAHSVYRVANALTGSSEHAGAVTRDVLVRACRGMLPSQRPESLRLSLYRLAVEASLTIRAGMWPNGTFRHQLELRFTPDGHRIEDGACGDWSVFAEPDLAAAVHAVLPDAVHHLPDPLAVALVLADGEGLSAVEVAEVTGVPTVVVRARAHQARMAVRERIAQALVHSPAA
jgi:DNA-directed RNA polymerase specialized sigma24 family protein